MPNGDLSAFQGNDDAFWIIKGNPPWIMPFSDNAPNATDSPYPGIINILIFNPEPEDLGPVDPVPVDPDPVPPEDELVYPESTSTNTSDPSPHEEDNSVELSYSSKHDVLLESEEDLLEKTDPTKYKKLRIDPETSTYIQKVKQFNGGYKWINTGVSVGTNDFYDEIAEGKRNPKW